MVWKGTVMWSSRTSGPQTSSQIDPKKTVGKEKWNWQQRWELVGHSNIDSLWLEVSGYLGVNKNGCVNVMCNMNYHVCVCVSFQGVETCLSLEASIAVTLHSNTPSAILVHPMGMASKGGSLQQPRFTLTNPSEEKNKKHHNRPPKPSPSKKLSPLPNKFPAFFEFHPQKTLFVFP